MSNAPAKGMVWPKSTKKTAAQDPAISETHVVSKLLNRNGGGFR